MNGTMEHSIVQPLLQWFAKNKNNLHSVDITSWFVLPSGYKNENSIII